MSATGIELDGEYRLLRDLAGVVDRSERAKVRVGGEDAVDFLQGQVTNDVEALAPGAGCYAALLDRKGHMQADLRVLNLDDGWLWLDTEAEAGATVLRHLGIYRVGRQVELDDATAGWAILSLIGPAAAELSGAGPLAPEHAQRRVELADTGCIAVATDLGVDLICPRDSARQVIATLAEAGAAEVSESAAEVLRVETGRPRFGREMTRETIPQEAGINERAVSFTKGCYIGQETVARLHYKGRPNRHLRGLRLAAPVASGDAIELDGRAVGQVGTAVISPALGPIALAVVRREAQPGASVEVGAARVGAEVVVLPF